MLLKRVVLSLVIVLLEWFAIAYSESVGSMTGPPKHRGFFIKQTGRNKTIPISERPGEEMIVFDVDGTLWPYQIDTDPIFRDPFMIKSYGALHMLCFSSESGGVQVGNRTIKMFPEVEETLLELIEKGYVLAAISLTNSTYKTMAVLNAFDLTKHFKYMEMASGPDKLSLITQICDRTGILLENVLYFERNSEEVIDMIWKHVIVYCVEKGLSKEVARKGLFVFDIRPRKEKSKHGPQPKTEKKETSNKNKCRPAFEKDGTEISGFDYNATQIEYS